MNRRELLGKTLVGVGSGAFSLLASPKHAQAVLPATGEVDVALPPGLVQLTSASGDVMEVKVPSTGIVTFQYEKLTLLGGLWQIYKPGTSVIKKILPKPGTFDLIYQKLVPAVDGISATAAWAYRHPSSDPGTQLRGAAPYQGAPMVLWLNSGPIQGVTIQLVDLDISPSTSQDLQALVLSPLPPVREVIASWNFPAGSGSRTRLLAPFPVPWNARFFVLRILQSLNQWVYIRLASDQPEPLGLGPLEIGWPVSP